MMPVLYILNKENPKIKYALIKKSSKNVKKIVILLFLKRHLRVD